MVHRSFQIGPWKVYPASNEIVCLARRGPGEGGGSGRTHLEPKAMDVLTFLSERAGQVVSKDELLAAVWPDVYVSDSTLFRVISELRRALEDSSRTPRFVQTVPKRGYRLVAPVVFDSEAPEATARPVNEAAESPAAARSFIRSGLTVALPGGSGPVVHHPLATHGGSHHAGCCPIRAHPLAVRRLPPGRGHARAGAATPARHTGGS